MLEQTDADGDVNGQSFESYTRLYAIRLQLPAPNRLYGLIAIDIPARYFHNEGLKSNWSRRMLR